MYLLIWLALHLVGAAAVMLISWSLDNAYGIGTINYGTSLGLFCFARIVKQCFKMIEEIHDL
jgi:hypothetical protein